MSKIKTDHGLSFLMELERKKLISEESEAKKKVIEEMYQLDILEVAVALFPLSEEGIARYIIVVELPPDRVQKIETLLKSLDILLKKPGERLEKTTYLKHNIIYSRYRQTKHLDEISTYTRLGNNIILGTGSEVLKKVIDVAEGKSGSIMEDKEFVKIRAKAIEAQDGFIYVSNKEARFAKTLREWEEDWHMTLFLSAESMASIGFFFDLLDENRAKGKIVFRATKKEALPAIQDDARFLGEAIKRKFIAEKINYSSKITTKGNYVTLNFTVWGLKPVWIKAFEAEEKVATLSAPVRPPGGDEAGAEAHEIRKEPKEREEAKVSSKVVQEEAEKPGYLLKIIFALLIGTIILLFLISEERKSEKK